MEKTKYIVTIQRQFGSMGRPIAKKMAEILGIEFYDRDIVEQAAAKLSLPISDVEKADESSQESGHNPFWKMMFPLGREGLEEQDKIFKAQSDIIRFLAERESCIIVGRCADFVLHDAENIINIYIFAPYAQRVKNSVEYLKLSEAEAKKMCVEVDQARAHYQVDHAGYKAGDHYTEHICIDSSMLGVDGTAAFLAEAVKLKFHLE